MTERNAMDTNAGLAMKLYGNLPNLAAAGFRFTSGMSKLEIIVAADEFAGERLEQVRQVEEEIDDIKGLAQYFGANTVKAWQRILARERAALAELRRGMKGTK
jgi:hypothetical protein